jgi:hypothetical protein
MKGCDVSKSRNPNDAIEAARAIGELVHSTEFKTKHLSYQDILNQRHELHARITAEMKPCAIVGPETQKNGTSKRWTNELLEQLVAYRETHKAKETAEHFGVSTTIVRAKIKTYKDLKALKATPFGQGLGSRSKN